MNKIIFITGTDTGVGKTYVSRVLADNLSGQGKRVSYMKPVQSGCVTSHSGEKVSPDADFVFSGKAIRVCADNLHVPFRFVPACSPHLAAEMEKTVISFDSIKNSLHTISGKADITIVEGAGGVLCPISDHTFMLDLMVFLDPAVVLVTLPALGTLNHTLLSLQALKDVNLKIAGVVMNNAMNHPVDYIYRDNIRFLQKKAQPSPTLELCSGDRNSKSVKEFCRDLERYL